MKAFTAIQHILSVLFIGVMALIWGIPVAPALWFMNEVNHVAEGQSSEWMGYLIQGVGGAGAFMVWGLSMLTLSGVLQAIIHPRVPDEGKVVKLFSRTTVGWAACAAMHRATKPFLVHVCPSIFANTYYRLAGVKMGSDVNITSEDINDPSLTRIGSGTVVGGKAAINGHIVEKGQLVLALIVIGESCLMGGGSLMMPGSKMEDNSVIGNRTLVPKYKSIPENEVWAGVPAKMVSQKSKRD